jgi:hypothetical protein
MHMALFSDKQNKTERSRNRWDKEHTVDKYSLSIVRQRHKRDWTYCNLKCSSIRESSLFKWHLVRRLDYYRLKQVVNHGLAN